MYDELPAVPSQVCIAHGRFVPCREVDGCEYSTEDVWVTAVRRWQSGELAYEWDAIRRWGPNLKLVEFATAMEDGAHYEVIDCRKDRDGEGAE